MDNYSLSTLKRDIRIDTTLQGNHYTFYTTWGLFSPKSIDEGTQLLINALEVNATDVSLDLGCGYGPIGIAIAKKSPQGIVHMVDTNFVAVEYAKKNAKVNRVENSMVYLSNAFSHVSPGISFDTIASNLPAKVGKELLTIIMYDAKKHLKGGGKLVVVTISGLKDYIKREFATIFGNYEKIKQGKTYTVSQAVKIG